MNKIEVLNLSGQVVYEEYVMTDELTIDLSDLSNGTYLIKVITEKGSGIQKITYL